MRIVSALAVGLSSFVFAAACSDLTSSAASIQAQVDALRGFAADDASATCTLLANCFTSAHASTTTMAATNANADGIQCVDAMAFHTDRYEASIRSGRLSFDAAAASAYFAAKASACATWTSDAEDAFERLFVGHVAEGGACAYDEECADGRRCEHAAGCHGVCVATGAQGDACATDADCRADVAGGHLACAPSGSDPTAHCVLVTTRVAALGEPCGWITPDGSARMDATCARGLDCQPSAANPSQSVCVTSLAIGAACTPGGRACPLGASCAPDGLGGQACATVGVASQPGDACGAALNVVCHPYARLACVGGRCASVGDGSLGAACRIDFPIDCGSGLVCGPASGHCEAPAAPVCL